MLNRCTDSTRCSYISWVEDRYLAHLQDFLCFSIQLNPIEVSMFRIGLDTNDRSAVPAFKFPKLRTEMDLNAVADLEGFIHFSCAMKTRIMQYQ